MPYGFEPMKCKSARRSQHSKDAGMSQVKLSRRLLMHAL